MDLVLHLLQRPAHRLRDLAVAEAVIDAEEQRRAPLVGKSDERAVEDPIGLAGQERGFGCGSAVHLSRLVIRGRKRIGIALAPAKLLQEDARRDPEQPGGQAVALLERAQLRVGPHEGLLGGLVRRRSVAEEVAEETPHGGGTGAQKHTKNASRRVHGARKSRERPPAPRRAHARPPPAPRGVPERERDPRMRPTREEVTSLGNWFQNCLRNVTGADFGGASLVFVWVELCVWAVRCRRPGTARDRSRIPPYASS